MRISRAFGLSLAEVRKARELSQEALAAEAGLDRTFISLLERGLRQPSLTTIFELAKALNVTATDLVASTEKTLKKPSRDPLKK